MFDLGFSELLIIGTVALIVIGPKDLPKVFQNVGRLVGKAKGMAREFSRAMEDAANESGVKDMAADLKKATNPIDTAFDDVKDTAANFKAWSPGGGATDALSEDRADAARKIREKTAQVAEDRKAREAAEAAAATQEADKAPIADTSPEAKDNA